jgi:hypothetical protein
LGPYETSEYVVTVCDASLEVVCEFETDAEQERVRRCRFRFNRMLLGEGSSAPSDYECDSSEDIPKC